MSSSRSRGLRCSGSRVPSTRTLSRSESTSSAVVSTPRSAMMSESSMSSHVCSSRVSWESRVSRPRPKTLLDLASRARSRARRVVGSVGVSYRRSSSTSVVSVSSTRSGTCAGGVRRLVRAGPKSTKPTAMRTMARMMPTVTRVSMAPNLAEQNIQGGPQPRTGFRDLPVSGARPQR